MSYPKKGRPGGFRHHERAPDPAEDSNRPLEPKARPHDVSGEEGESEADPGDVGSEPPHRRLNHPVGEPDPAADSDPYDPDRDAEDPPPAGQFPGPGPEPETAEEDDEPGFAR